MEQLTDRLVNWASVLDPQTLEQARRTSELPFVYPYVALMPDAHLGKGATVGSVIPTRGAVIPAAVGVDIGCGMIAVRTPLRGVELRTLDLRALRRAIELAVPLSAGRYNSSVGARAQARVAELEALPVARDPDGVAGNWRLQLGSLGSGNHFIEISTDEDDAVWAFLHSGSRGVGNRIAQHYIGVARSEAAQARLRLPDPDLAHLSEGTTSFEDYTTDLRWAQHFALLNREEMMDRVLDCLAAAVGWPVAERERINCHHNFSEQEQHFGELLWVSRKGAIEARTGQLGVIPGSMGTASYVVSGLGNAASFSSAPHGAGRVFSRTRARKTFTHAQLREAMAGIEFRDTDAFLDEIPQAYKDIEAVMRDASDLVEVRHELHQLVNVKGD